MLETPNALQAFYSDLQYLGILRASGADVIEFLHNQFSNDIHKVSSSLSQISSYNSAKGRMYAIFRVVKHGDDYWLIMPRELIAFMIKRLTMFILRAKVSLEDISDEYKITGYCGEPIRRYLQTAVQNLPTETDAVSHSEDSCIIRLTGLSPRFLLIGSNNGIDSLQQAVNQSLTEHNSYQTTESQWLLSDIAVGIPTLFTATQETFIPQMTNLHLINGVNFKKGCYPGQEIVARMQYLGKLKKRMYNIIVRSQTHPKPGDAIYAATETQSVGTIVDARLYSDNNTYAGLAVLNIEKADNTKLYLQSDDDSTELIVEKPIYGFPKEA